MAHYDLEQVVDSYDWLGHEGVTELFAQNPEYKPGKKHFEWNRKHQTMPVTAYAGSVDDVTAFVRKHAGTRMVCMSLNERPEEFKNQWGYPRAAKEPEVELSRNLMIDIDFENKQPSKTQLLGLEEYIKKEIFAWYQDLGFLKPVLSFSGRGYHLFTGYEPITVATTPDIAQRLRKFNFELHDSHKDGLGGIGAEVDTNVFDLRRMVKIPSTAKPGVGVNSVWYGGKRQVDAGLHSYLFSMVLDEAKTSRQSMAPVYGPKLITADSELPDLFRHLLRHDEKLRDLWHGRRKVNGDASRSGYDFSLTRHLIVQGYRNIDDLATVLIARPDGAVRQAGKGEDYVRRTIANAILK